MIRHFCDTERCWLDFEGICGWCNKTEAQAQQDLDEDKAADERFRQMVKRMEAAARTDITDD